MADGAGKPRSPGGTQRANKIHLSPLVFAHFWSWWGLFNHALSLPIRHGPLFLGSRAPSPKFGDHLYTIKYRIVLAPLVISHIYHQDSRAAWKDGTTTCVGIKLQMDELHADMHQREQIVKEYDANSKRTIARAHKLFDSAEVVMSNSELRAVRAFFAEPQKALFPTPTEFDEPSAAGLPDSDPEPLNSPWIDMDDFVEMDWVPSDIRPRIWLIACGFCPRFTYLKRVPTTASSFGDEGTHNCLQGREECELYMRSLWLPLRISSSFLLFSYRQHSA